MLNESEASLVKNHQIFRCAHLTVMAQELFCGLLREYPQQGLPQKHLRAFQAYQHVLAVAAIAAFHAYFSNQTVVLPRRTSGRELAAKQKQ